MKNKHNKEIDDKRNWRRKTELWNLWPKSDQLKTHMVSNHVVETTKYKCNECSFTTCWMTTLKEDINCKCKCKTEKEEIKIVISYFFYLVPFLGILNWNLPSFPYWSPGYIFIFMIEMLYTFIVPNKEYIIIILIFVYTLCISHFVITVTMGPVKEIYVWLCQFNF